jgi:hypothetical protein
MSDIFVIGSCLLCRGHQEAILGISFIPPPLSFPCPPSCSDPKKTYDSFLDEEVCGFLAHFPLFTMGLVLSVPFFLLPMNLGQTGIRHLHFMPFSVCLSSSVRLQFHLLSRGGYDLGRNQL